jgi:hypothetical protein
MTDTGTLDATQTTIASSTRQQSNSVIQRTESTPEQRNKEHGAVQVELQERRRKRRCPVEHVLILPMLMTLAGANSPRASSKHKPPLDDGVPSDRDTATEAQETRTPDELRALEVQRFVDLRRLFDQEKSFFSQRFEATSRDGFLRQTTDTQGKTRSLEKKHSSLAARRRDALLEPLQQIEPRKGGHSWHGDGPRVPGMRLFSRVTSAEI